MANKNGVVSIGLNVDYEKSLKQMVDDFKAKMRDLSRDVEKIEYSKGAEKSFDKIFDKINGVEKRFSQMFEELNAQKLDASNFENYQKEMSKHLDIIKTDIVSLTAQIENLGNKEFVSGLVSQFESISRSVRGAYGNIEKIFDITKTFGTLDTGVIDEYKAAIGEIKKLRGETERLQIELDTVGADTYKESLKGSKTKVAQEFAQQKKIFDSQFKNYERLKSELKSLSDNNPYKEIVRSHLAVNQAELERTLAAIDVLENKLMALNANATFPSSFTPRRDIIEADEFSKEVSQFVESAEKAKASYQEITTLQLKNGKIHVPVRIDKNSTETLRSELEKVIEDLKTHTKKNPIIASVKLVMDDGSLTSRKKNTDFDQQQKDGQKKPAADLSPSIAKAYREGAKIAEESVKAGMAEIQKAFKDVPVTFKPDTEAFKTELKAMIDDSFKAIAEDITGLNVNQELEKLVGNLKEVSTSLSGNESFKFGLDEDSIERITAAIRDMADMIQRAFGVASNEDIAAQWSTIESKFKSVAGEERKLLKGNKEHKVAIQELAVEYKKYFDMGGKNDLSELTTHKQTVKNITAEYENLGKAAQEATQKQERVAKKPASKKVSSEEAEAIKGITRENKKLETQAAKTGTALDNEAKSAQSAAEKFRKLAKEKGAAVLANRELAKAAKETADALEREAKARKSGAGKTNKNAIDEGVYSSNFLKWQSDIETSLRDSGNYADVYEAKISQATNGTVKFTAVVRDLDGNLKKFSAGVNDIGGVFSPSVSEMGEKQAADFEKRLKIAERVREAIAAMDGEGVEPIRLDKSEMQQYSGEVLSILNALEELSKTTYKIDLTNDGKLVIAKKEIADTGAEAKAFTVTIDRIDDILEETADGVVVSSSKIEAALNSAFDSAKISTSTKDLASKAQDAFDKFELKHKSNSNWSQVADDMSRLKQDIATIDSQDALNKFKQILSDIAVKLNNIGKDNKLGKIIDENRTFGNINEVRANIDSLFASMGKVNEKSIRITGTDKLTAEVKSASGEIRKMAVSLDSNGFARFVDKGIVEFGRLRSAAEGVFKGIQSMVRIYLSPQDFIRYFRQGFDAVREVDTAMTELKKVSDASSNDIAAYFDTAAASAKELGSSINEMIGATADWSRMGKSLPDSKELAEVAVLYKNVGDNIDVEEATSSLVSTLQGFQMDAKDAIKIVDSFNEVA